MGESVCETLSHVSQTVLDFVPISPPFFSFHEVIIDVSKEGKEVRDKLRDSKEKQSIKDGQLMKRKISLLAVVSLIAAVALGMMGNRAHAVPMASSPTTLTFKGMITLWSTAPNFSSPKVESLITPVTFTPDTTDRNWATTITKLSIPWSGSTVLTLQNGRVASGAFDPSTNAARLTLPLQGIPVIKTLNVDLTTNKSITTITNQTISGSRVDRLGNLTLVGSKSVSVFLFLTVQTQVSVQGTLSPWPLR
jgi:hypothetical protein